LGMVSPAQKTESLQNPESGAVKRKKGNRCGRAGSYVLSTNSSNRRNILLAVPNAEKGGGQ